MTIHGGQEDVTLPPVPLGAAADAPEASYRQDDAPPGSSPEPGTYAGEDEPRVLPPTRSVPEVLAALRATPAELARLINGQSDEALARPASDGEWGVVEILPHLGDWETVQQGWIHRLLDEDTPSLEPVDDSLWSIERDYAGQPPEASLAAFAERRAETVHLLESLDDGTWQREAIHPRLGRLTLHQLAERMCDHDARHIEQARDALA
jgi:hypothetical protein